MLFRAKQKQELGDKVQDCRDGSRLNFIIFADFVTGGHGNCHSVVEFGLLAIYVVSSVTSSLLLSLLAMFSLYFKII